MRYRMFGSMFALLALGPILVATPVHAQSAPLAPFERLVGGEWRSGGTIQIFEWGPGRSSVIARSYSEEAGGRVPVRWAYGTRILRTGRSRVGRRP